MVYKCEDEILYMIYCEDEILYIMCCEDEILYIICCEDEILYIKGRRERERRMCGIERRAED